MNMMWIISILIFASLVALAFALRSLLFRDYTSPEQETKRRLRELENRASPSADAIPRSLLKDKSLSSIPLLDRILNRVPKTADLRLLIHQAGNPCNLGTLVLLVALMAVVGLFLGNLQANPTITLGAVVLSAMMPIIWLRLLRKRRLAMFDEQFFEAVELIARALRAGHSFGSALSMAAEEMDDPVSDELARTAEDYAFGKTMEDALNGLSHRVGLQDVKFFVTAVSLQRDTGGNLTEVLDNIGHIIRERFRLLRQVKTLSAEGRLSGTILSIMPPGLLVALWFLSPGYISTLFEHPTGRTMLWVGLTLQVVGVLTIRKLIKLKV